MLSLPSKLYCKQEAPPLAKVEEGNSSSHQSAYNIALQETPTLQQFLEEMARQLHTTVHFIEVNQPEDSDSSDSDSENTSQDSINEYYPSVSFGPVDISKALRHLQWKPTTMKEALAVTCQFFENATKEFPDLVPIDDFSEGMIATINQMYGVNITTN